MAGQDESEKRGSVVDSSAVLAWLLGETGGERVEAELPGVISAVNLTEVVIVGVRNGLSPTELRLALSELPLSVVPFSLEHVYATAVLHSKTRQFGFSLADCACMSLAVQEGLPVVTCERRWSEAGLTVPVRCVR